MKHILSLLTDEKFNVKIQHKNESGVGQVAEFVVWSASALASAQGFMQDKIIASHTCFGGHMDVYKLLNVSDDLKWTTNTGDTIFTNFQGIANNIYGFGRPFFAPSYFYPSTHISTHPYSFSFYPSK